MMGIDIWFDFDNFLLQPFDCFHSFIVFVEKVGQVART
jgi:hypothetical protein